MTSIIRRRSGLIVFRLIETSCPKGKVSMVKDEATSVVYGMPQEARKRGAVEDELPLSRISAAMMRLASS